MDPPHHPAPSYDTAYYGQPNPNIYPPSSHAYYPPSSAATPHPHHPPHVHQGSSSDSSPYDGMPQGKSPPSYQTSSYTDHAHSSSFESHGSSNGGGDPPYAGLNPASQPGDPNLYDYHHPPPHPPPPPHSYHHQPMMMGPPPPMYGYHPGYPWQVPPPIEYVYNVNPTDVMSGRGGATNTHSGNRTFRALVKQYQKRYLEAKKRDKPDVAVEVVNVIRRRGGRFLRKSDVPGPQGEVLYYDIGDKRAVEKACQALREGAPVLRAKKSRGDKDTTTPSSEDDDGKCTSSGEPLEQVQKEESLATSTFEQPAEEENKENSEKTSLAKQSDNNSGEHEGPGDPGRKQEGPLVIQPCARFLQRDYIKPISLDDLPAEDRETYLKEFLPPEPSFQANEDQKPSASQIVSV